MADKTNQMLLEVIKELRRELAERDARVLEAMDKLRASNDALAHLAVTDPLTGLSNRRHFEDGVRREFRRAQRHQHPLAVVMLDVDQLKNINDTLGHPAGDAALITVADAIRGVQRASDFAARLGGDEFAVALVETDVTGALLCAERLVQAIAQQPLVLGARTVVLTVSAGVAVLAAGKAGAGALALDSSPSLLDRADTALLKAKGGGKNRVVLAG